MAENNALWDWGDQKYYHEKIKQEIEKASTGGVTIDSELDVNSENLIQNKAVAEAFQDIYAKTVQNLTTLSGVDIKEAVLTLGSGCVFIDNTVTGMPVDGTWWFGEIHHSVGHLKIEVTRLGSVITNVQKYDMVYNNSTSTWIGWKNVADGGNADMLDGLHASSLAKATVLNTIDQVNDPWMESGIYTVEGVGMTFPTLTCSFFVLIVNKHLRNSGYNTQIAIPYENGGMYGVFYRNCAAGTWGAWQSVGNGCNADTVDGKHATDLVSVNGRAVYDCNTLFDTGIYLVDHGTNTPTGVTCGSLLVMPYRKAYGNTIPDFVTQIFISNGDYSAHSMWYRTSIKDTFNDWKNVKDADTVDGKHASDFASSDDNYFLYTYSENGGKHGASHRIKAIYNVQKDGRFYLQDEDSHLVRVGYADAAVVASNADYAGSLVTTATNKCLRNISAGTAAATTSNCPNGALYGQYS